MVIKPKDVVELGYLTDLDTGDLQPRVKRTLGQYLDEELAGEHDLTRKNAISPPATDAEQSLNTPEGEPTGPGIAPPPPEGFGLDLSSYSKSEYIGKTIRSVGEFLQKGGHVVRPGRVTGNEFLGIVDSTATAPEDANNLPGKIVQAHVAAIVGAYNRFKGAEDRFTLAASRVASVQKTKGRYDPNALAITSETLAKVGPLLSLRGTGEFLADGPVDPDAGDVQAATLLPGEAQLVSPLGMPTSRLDASLALADLLRAAGADSAAVGALARPAATAPDDAQGGDGRYAGRTSGNMNNHLEPFSGLLPLGMIALHITLAVVAFVGIQVLMFLLAMLAQPAKTARDADGSRPKGKHLRTLGQSEGSLDVADIADFIGIKPIRFDFKRCVNKGFSVFYGLEDGSATDKLQKIALEAPGYYAMFSRLLTRAVASTAQKIDEAVDSATGPLEVINSVVGIADAIRGSRIISVINFFAQLGDMRIALEKDEIDDIEFGSNLDKLRGDPSVRSIIRHREANSVRLAWRCGAARSSVVLPATVILGGAAIAEGGAGVVAAYAKGTELDDLTIADRIKTEDRERLERALDSEYVPFYFHDLRTNEIVAFHSFLKSLGDSITPEWTETEGYGRVDPIGTYKRTRRRVSLSFYAVSTSPDDFDVMWRKLDRLAQMCYPQWSRGRIMAAAVGGETIAFVQPFSQVLAGSPLIRMRVGDVVRSNYSRFGLARVFGLGIPGTFGSTAPSAGTSTEDEMANIEASGALRAAKDHADVFNSFMNRMLTGDWRSGDTAFLRPCSDPVSTGFGGGYSAREQGGGGLLDSLNPLSGFTDDPTNLPLRNVSPVRVRVVDVAGDDFPGGFIVKPTLLDGAVSLNEYIAYSGDLSPDEDELAVKLKGSFPGGPKPEAVQRLMSIDNPVVRSFEEAGGKGLGGWISSLSIDFGESTWETEVYGSQAPKFCKITLEFSVVHDIAPGIGHDGSVRAPVYPVGRAVRALVRGSTGARADRDEFEARRRIVNTVRVPFKQRG